MTEGKVVSLSSAIGHPFFIDIETIADPDTFHLMEKISAPANYKDPEKIDSYITQKYEERKEKAALDVDHARVLSIGVKKGLQGTPTISLIPPSDSLTDEIIAIQHFWRLYERAQFRLTGWGIRSFDLPFLLRRSFALGIKIPLTPILRKWSTYPILDLQDVLHSWEQPYKSLKYYAKRYNIPTKFPDITGKDVASMSAQEIIDYQTDELEIQAMLFQLMDGVYFMELELLQEDL